MAALLAISKGRSSTPRMAQICRKIEALSLACSLSLFWRWIPSEWNGGDFPSRGKPLSTWVAPAYVEPTWIPTPVGHAEIGPAPRSKAMPPGVHEPLRVEFASLCSFGGSSLQHPSRSDYALRLGGGGAGAGEVAAGEVGSRGSTTKQTEATETLRGSGICKRKAYC